jgi:hypothetical protein
VEAAQQAGRDIHAALRWSEEPVERSPLVHEVVGNRLREIS